MSGSLSLWAGDTAQEAASGREWVLSWAGPSAHAVTEQMFPESPSVLGTEPHGGLEPGAPLAFLGGRQPRPLLPRVVTPWQRQQGLWRQKAAPAAGPMRLDQERGDWTTAWVQKGGKSAGRACRHM